MRVWQISWPSLKGEGVQVAAATVKCRLASVSCVSLTDLGRLSVLCVLSGSWQLTGLLLSSSSKTRSLQHPPTQPAHVINWTILKISGLNGRRSAWDEPACLDSRPYSQLTYRWRRSVNILTSRYDDVRLLTAVVGPFNLIQSRDAGVCLQLYTRDHSVWWHWHWHSSRLTIDWWW